MASCLFGSSTAFSSSLRCMYVLPLMWEIELRTCFINFSVFSGRHWSDDSLLVCYTALNLLSEPNCDSEDGGSKSPRNVRKDPLCCRVLIPESSIIWSYVFNIYSFKLASLTGRVPIYCAFGISHISVAEGESLLGCDGMWLGVTAQGGTVWTFVYLWFLVVPSGMCFDRTWRLSFHIFRHWTGTADSIKGTVHPRTGHESREGE